MTPGSSPAAERIRSALLLALAVPAGAVAGRYVRRLREAKEQLEQTRSGLARADAEVLRISARAEEMTDRNEVEMGRLESSAIAAFESAATAHRAEAGDLRLRLGSAQDEVRSLRAQLESERGRAALLQSALAERDHRLATLRATARELDT